MAETDKNDPYKREANGNFAKGTRGGPGRPPGVPRLIQTMHRLWNENAEAYSEVFDKMLRDGDGTAWKLLMERGIPVPKQVALDVDADVEVKWRDPKKD